MMFTKIASTFLFLVALALMTGPANAQAPLATEQAGSEVEVTGTFVNRSPGGGMPESLSVMLHVLDQNYSQIGMYHAPSQQDGSFGFEDVEIKPGEFVAGIVSYLGASYHSEPVAYDGKTNPHIEIPIYETSIDLSKVQVDEMHVLFNFALDGLEVSEIYLLSNLGDYTITGTLTLTDGQPATVEFPLPIGADYVFFKPDNPPDRFVTLPGSFADKAALVPGERTSQFMVSYLQPYNDEMSYSYTAPLAIANIDFLLPSDQEVILDGSNLEGPEITTFQDGSVYQVYTYKGLSANQTIKLSFLGIPDFGSDNAAIISSPKAPGLDKYLAIKIGIGALGLTMVTVGAWRWWKTRDDEVENVADYQSNKPGLNEIVTKIADLDEARDRGAITAEEHQQRRARLRMQAKALLDENEDGL